MIWFTLSLGNPSVPQKRKITMQIRTSVFLGVALAMAAVGGGMSIVRVTAAEGADAPGPVLISQQCTDGSRIQMAALRASCDEIAEKHLFKHGVVRPYTQADQNAGVKAPECGLSEEGTKPLSEVATEPLSEVGTEPQSAYVCEGVGKQQLEEIIVK
jgi:hypothetical protein